MRALPQRNVLLVARSGTDAEKLALGALEANGFTSGRVLSIRVGVHAQSGTQPPLRTGWLQPAEASRDLVESSARSTRGSGGQCKVDTTAGSSEDVASHTLRLLRGVGMWGVWGGSGGGGGLEGEEGGGGWVGWWGGVGWGGGGGGILTPALGPPPPCLCAARAP
ncbi:hypothetical protein T492DRAFT_835784 [Pavlovales sp. CCMP2436]|nr:hypothetical protein T492DRAFT_835784 [Pavlovales sp. CCMP2436]